MSTSLSCSKACQVSNGKTCVFSDSVLKDMHRIDGTPTEFEWKIFTRITALGLTEKIQRLMTELQCDPQHFKDKNIFMSTYNDMASKKRNKEQCEHDSQTVANYARKLPRGHWSFLETGSEEKWYGTYTDKSDGSWDRMAEEMRVTTAKKKLRSKGGSKKSTHFNGSDETIELLRRTVISANQLSIYGAIADLCNELSKDLNALEKPTAPDNLDNMEICTGETCSTWEFGKTFEIFNNCQKTRNYPNYVLMRVWSLSKQDSTSTPLIQEKVNRCNIDAENSRCFEMKKRLMWEDGFARIRESVQSGT